MHTPYRISKIFVAPALCAAVLFSAHAAHAMGTIVIDQTSDIEATGTWTLTYPNNETLERVDTHLQIDDAQPGRYLFSIRPPTGETATIELKIDDVVTEIVSLPQISFVLADESTAALSVHQALSHFGRVGVNSDPAGIEFTLRGPDGLTRNGVTPQTFESMPIGNYSVQYKPINCPLPPGKSDVLKKDGSSYFFLMLKCAEFESATSSSDATHVETQVKGQVIMFHDVPVSSWFAQFVETVSRRGILTGYRDASGQQTGEFGPGNPVTVGELAKIAHEMADIDELTVTVPPVNSTAVGKWFTKYIASAEERGWHIYQDPSLDLVRSATRGEVLMTLLQVLNVPLQWVRGNAFGDVTFRTPYASAIETASAVHLVSGATDEAGNPTGLFHPDDPITRAEMAKILITVEEEFRKTGVEEPN